MMIGMAAVMDGGEMRDHPGLRRLVVIGGHHERHRPPPFLAAVAVRSPRPCCSTRRRSPATGATHHGFDDGAVFGVALASGFRRWCPPGQGPRSLRRSASRPVFFSVSISTAPSLNGVTRAGIDPLIMARTPWGGGLRGGVGGDGALAVAPAGVGRDVIRGSDCATDGDWASMRISCAAVPTGRVCPI